MSTAVDVVRLSLHVGAATVWVGGQVVVAALVGPLRALGPEAGRVMANAFARVAWPAFGVLVLTGGWNIAAAHHQHPAALGVKMLLVLLSGAAVLLHTRAGTPRGRGVWGGLGLLASLGAMVAGVTLTELG